MLNPHNREVRPMLVTKPLTTHIALEHMPPRRLNLRDIRRPINLSNKVLVRCNAARVGLGEEETRAVLHADLDGRGGVLDRVAGAVDVERVACSVLAVLE